MDINWRLYSFVRIAIVFIIGILAMDALGALGFKMTFMDLGVLILLVLPFLFLKKLDFKHRKSIGILLLIFLLGSVRYLINNPLEAQTHYSKLENSDHYIGTIKEYPKTRTKTKTIISIHTVCRNDSCFESSGDVLVYFPKNDTTATQITPGEGIILKAKYTNLAEPANPLTFDFKSYLFYRKINYQIFLNDTSNYSLVEISNLNWLQKIANSARAELIKTLGSYFENNDKRAVISAMVLGYKNQLESELYQKFTNSGAVHILAVSGLHVGVVCYLFVLLFNKWRSTTTGVKLIKVTALIFIVWSYAILSGAAPAVIRAAIMFSILLVGKYWFDHYKMLNIIALSAFLMLVYDPYLLFQASFQFSYISLISIITFQPKLNKIFYFENKLLSSTWNLITVAIAAQILVFPITIYYFHKFPSYFILTGVVAVPIAILILYIGLALLFSHYLLPIISKLIAILLSLLLDAFLKIIEFIHLLPMSNMDGLWISRMELIIIYMGLIYMSFYFYFKKYTYLKWIGISTILFLASFGWRQYENTRQREVIIYSSPKGSIIDIFTGKTSYTFSDLNLAKEDVDFVSKNYRDSKGIKRIVGVFSHNNYESELRVFNQMVKINDLVFQFIDKQPQILNNLSNYYILYNKSKVKPSDLTKINTNATIILDATIKSYIIKEWESFCTENNMQLILTRRKAHIIPMLK